MNEYEMNGRLMEISLAADCDFLDLVFIKEQIKDKGLTVDSLRELNKIGFPGQIENFDKAVFEFSEMIGIVSTIKIQTLGYKLSRFSKEFKEANRN